MCYIRQYNEFSKWYPLTRLQADSQTESQTSFLFINHLVDKHLPLTLKVDIMFTLSDVCSKLLTTGRFSGGSSERSRHGKTTSLFSSGCSGAQRYMVAKRRAISSGGDAGMAACNWSTDSRPSWGSWLRLSSHISLPITSAPNQSGSSTTSSSLSFFRNTT